MRSHFGQLFLSTNETDGGRKEMKTKRTERHGRNYFALCSRRFCSGAYGIVGISPSPQLFLRASRVYVHATSTFLLLIATFENQLVSSYELGCELHYLALSLSLMQQG